MKMKIPTALSVEKRLKMDNLGLIVISVKPGFIEDAFTCLKTLSMNTKHLRNLGIA